MKKFTFRGGTHLHEHKDTAGGMLPDLRERTLPRKRATVAEI